MFRQSSRKVSPAHIPAPHLCPAGSVAGSGLNIPDRARRGYGTSCRDLALRQQTACAGHHRYKESPFRGYFGSCMASLSVSKSGVFTGHPTLSQETRHTSAMPTNVSINPRSVYAECPQRGHGSNVSSSDMIPLVFFCISSLSHPSDLEVKTKE